MRFATAIGVMALLTTAANAVDTLTFRDRNTPDAEAVTLTAPGRVLASDTIGNRFFETVNGARYFIPARDLVSESADDTEFAPSTPDELGDALLADLPRGFRTHTTAHYVVAYDTSREYAEWTSALLEGLYRAFTRYWKKQGLDISEPEFPLPIVIHRTAAHYGAAARFEGVTPGAIGYYNLKTNRVRMYDLTGADQLRAAGAVMRRGSRREITQMLSLPVAEPLVATIVHEATHQVAFNTGVMQRMADLPLWVVEGMAVYFEAPDAASGRGWGGIGKVNRRRLATFKRHLPEWNNRALTSLLATDDRLRDPRTAGVAYADAWALNYYLIKKRRKDYVAYVRELAAREPLQGPSADATDESIARERIELFEEYFGPIGEVQKELLSTMRRL